MSAPPLHEMAFCALPLYAAALRCAVPAVCVCVFELLLPAAVCFELLRPGALRGAQRAVVCVV